VKFAPTSEQLNTLKSTKRHPQPNAGFTCQKSSRYFG